MAAGALVVRWCTLVPWRKHGKFWFYRAQLSAAVGYALLWYLGVLCIGSLRHALETHHFVLGSFSGHALQWHFFSGLIIYGNIAGAVYVLQAPQMRLPCSVVFITAHGAHALTAYALGAFDYLLKPVLPERFGLPWIVSVSVESVHKWRNLLEDRLNGVLDSGLLHRFFVRHLARCTLSSSRRSSGWKPMTITQRFT